MEPITLKHFMVSFMLLKSLGMLFNSCVVNKKTHLTFKTVMNCILVSGLAEMWKYSSVLRVCEK